MSELFVSQWPGLVWSSVTTQRPNGSMQRATNAWIDGSGRLSARPGFKYLRLDSGLFTPDDFVDALAVRSLNMLTLDESTVPPVETQFLMCFDGITNPPNAEEDVTQYSVAQVAFIIQNWGGLNDPTYSPSQVSRCTGYLVGATDSEPIFWPWQGTRDRPGLTQYGSFAVSHYQREHMFGLVPSNATSSNVNAIGYTGWHWYGFGVPYAYIPSSYELENDSAGFLGPNKSTAYVACVVLTINKTEWIGPASVPFTVSNPGDPANVRLKWPVPPQTYLHKLAHGRDPNILYADTKAVFRVYRSVIQTDITAKGHATDYRLVYEQDISGDVSGGIVFTDIVPDAGDYGGLMGEACYVSENIGEGFAQRNEWAPGCGTTETFHGITFYGNIWDKSIASLSLLRVGSGGIDDGTTVTIHVENPNTIDFHELILTARNSPSTVTDFQVYTAGTTTQNLRDTSIALSRAINANLGDGRVFAEPVGNAEGQPLDIARIFIACTHPRYRFLTDPTGNSITGYGITISSDPNSYRLTAEGGRYRTNRIAFSKQNQPYAVPSLNFFDIGTEDLTVWCLKASNNSVFAFTNRGIYRIYLDTSGPVIELFDKTIFVDGPDCIASIGARIYALARNQIVAVTEGGAMSVSESIRPYLELTNGNGQAGRFSHALAWTAQRKVIFNLFEYIFKDNVTWRSLGSLVYDEVTKTWTIAQSDEHDTAIVGSAEQKQRPWFLTRDSFLQTNASKARNSLKYWRAPVDVAAFGDENISDTPTGLPNMADTNVDIVLSQALTAPASMTLWTEVQAHWHVNVFDAVQLNNYASGGSTGITATFYASNDLLDSGAASYTANGSAVTRFNVPQSQQRTPMIQLELTFAVNRELGTPVLQGVTYIAEQLSTRSRSEP